ncbi:UNC93-like protein MFSD11 [Haliotis cracherodii]|uniref:UNC93-like protein MFSD11 n=1 Tax=Haliotis cracherodii TaxID=6455 RepID=UPI0039EABB3A
MATGGCDVRLYNIIILGLAFMFIFTAFQTCSMVEKTVLDSVGKSNNDTNNTFSGNGYTSLGIIYGVFSLSNWAAPSFVSYVGPKLSMIIGALLYFLFILSFLKPMEWALYLGSALVGFGAAILWTAQGSTLTINSDTETVARNSGIFWALLQCSLLFGNMYSYFVFKSKSEVTDIERTDLFIGLSSAALLGVLCLFLIRKKRPSDAENLVNLNSSGSHSADTALSALKRSLQLLKTKEMIYLSFTFAYTGLELTFFSGVYGTCVSHNLHFGAERNGLLGLSGIFIGVGEILGGGIFGLFGKRTNTHGRDPIVLFGYVLHLVAFFLIFLNMPNNSSLTDSAEATYIESNKYVALVCSFLLGLGDSSFNTQLYSVLGFMFPEDSAPAFALFKFVQSIAAAAAFAYSIFLSLQWTLLILVITGTIGQYCFNVIEWSSSRSFNDGYMSID